MTTRPEPRSAGYRYPSEIITTAVWLYFRFPLSLRMVEEMLVARGITVSYETIRQWGLKFGRDIANNLRRREPRRGDKWHLDEVVLTIAGKHHYLWRAVDRDGFVLDVLVQSRRDKKAAKRLLRTDLLSAGVENAAGPRVKCGTLGNNCESFPYQSHFRTSTRSGCLYLIDITENRSWVLKRRSPQPSEKRAKERTLRGFRWPA